jgi:hypothetical protein
MESTSVSGRVMAYRADAPVTGSEPEATAVSTALNSSETGSAGVSGPTGTESS